MFSEYEDGCSLLRTSGLWLSHIRESEILVNKWLQSRVTQQWSYTRTSSLNKKRWTLILIHCLISISHWRWASWDLKMSSEMFLSLMSNKIPFKNNSHWVLETSIYATIKYVILLKNLWDWWYLILILIHRITTGSGDCATK